MKPAQLFRERLAQGRSALGVWRTLSGAALTEIVTSCGFDFQIFDLEHGTMGLPDVQAMVTLQNALGGVSLIRLGDKSPLAAQTALDSGAHGIVYPLVGSAGEAARLVENLRFAPAGRRGFNPFVAAFAYGRTPTPSDVTPLLVPIVESREGLENLAAICRVDGVDAIYLGAYDLSVQLGTPGQIESPVVLAALEQAVATCREAGRPVSLMVNSRAALDRWTAAGVRVFLHGVDGGNLFRAVSSIQK